MNLVQMASLCGKVRTYSNKNGVDVDTATKHVEDGENYAKYLGVLRRVAANKAGRYPANVATTAKTLLDKVTSISTGGLSGRGRTVKQYETGDIDNLDFDIE